MISNSNALVGIQCPLSFCTRPHCPFRHTKDSDTQQQQQQSTQNAVIVQEETPMDFQTGYMGYMGSMGGTQQCSPQFNGYQGNVYSQGPATYQPSMYQQQPQQQFNRFQQQPSYSSMQPQASLYAPEDPVTFAPQPYHMPPRFATSVASVAKPVYGQLTSSGRGNAQPVQNQPRHVPSPSPPPTWNAMPSASPERTREQFSPVNEIVPIKPKERNFERKGSAPNQPSKPQKRRMQEEQQHQQRKGIVHRGAEHPVERDKEIDDILSTASHASVPSMTKPPPPKRKAHITVGSTHPSDKSTKLGKRSASTQPPTKPANPILQRIEERRKKQEKEEMMKKASNLPSELVYESKAGPASIMRAKKDRDSRSSSNDRESSVEFVSLQPEHDVKKKSSHNPQLIDLSSPPHAINRVKDKLNDNIKAIADIDRRIAEKEHNLVNKDGGKMAWKPKSLEMDKPKKSVPVVPAVATGALHNPDFDINSLFDDDDFVEEVKVDKASATKSQCETKSNGSTQPGSIKPQTSTTVNSTRVAHASTASTSASSGFPPAKKRVPSAQEQMRNRYANAAPAPALGNRTDKEPVRNFPLFKEGKSRIAQPVQSPTTAKKLELFDPFNKKGLPYKFRWKYLEMIHEEYLKIPALSWDERRDKAMSDEKEIFLKAGSKIAYQAAIANVIQRIRGLKSKVEAVRKNTTDGISHNIVLAGRNAPLISIGVQRAKKDNRSQIGDAEFYEVLRGRYLMSKEQLYENGYPIWSDEATKQLAMVKPPEDPSRRQRIVADENLKRICSRCGTEYRLNKDGSYANTDEDECVYHWGKAWKKRHNGALESRYTCCDQDLTVKGCTILDHHITDTTRNSTLQRYVETPRPVGVGDPRSHKVYAIDCEMVYGVWGTQLARVSMVDVLDELVLDEIVRPDEDNPIVDCNTRFSGLTKDQIEKAKCNLSQIHSRIFELVNSETILIGHSLESDLKAMRIIHGKVVDTSVVFPHRLGPPKKRALKSLCSDYLTKIIQEDENGHDSKEDASACLQLMLHKVRADVTSLSSGV